MHEDEAIERLSSLAHATRLRVFRLLAAEGEAGLPSGEIARQLQIPATTMSTHLGILTRAGLVLARRESRTVFYSVAPQGVRDLLDYLVSDCCGGRPELCAPTLRPVRRALR